MYLELPLQSPDLVEIFEASGVKTFHLGCNYQMDSRGCGRFLLYSGARAAVKLRFICTSL